MPQGKPGPGVRQVMRPPALKARQQYPSRPAPHASGIPDRLDGTWLNNERTAPCCKSCGNIMEPPEYWFSITQCGAGTISRRTLNPWP